MLAIVLYHFALRIQKAYSYFNVEIAKYQGNKSFPVFQSSFIKCFYLIYLNFLLSYCLWIFRFTEITRYVFCYTFMHQKTNSNHSVGVIYSVTECAITSECETYLSISPYSGYSSTLLLFLLASLLLLDIDTLFCPSSQTVLCFLHPFQAGCFFQIICSYWETFLLGFSLTKASISAFS